MWVPTWATGARNVTDSFYSAITRQTPSTPAEVTFPGNGRILRTNGVSIGRVAGAGSSCPHWETLDEDSLHLVLLEWEAQLLGFPVLDQRSTHGQELLKNQV